MAERRSWVCDICKAVIEQAERQPVYAPIPREPGEPPQPIDLCWDCAVTEKDLFLKEIEGIGYESARAAVQAALTGLGLGGPVIAFLKRSGKVIGQESEEQEPEGEEAPLAEEAEAVRD